jgi:hypothetical protein
VFDRLPPGSYRVIAQKEGYAYSVPGLGPRPHIATVVVTAGQTRDVQPLALDPGGAIAGHIFDSSGRPLNYARVFAMREFSTPVRVSLAPIGPAAQTNYRGEFRLVGLPAGDYYLEATPQVDVTTPEGAAPARATLLAPTFFPRSPDRTTARTLHVSTNATTDGIEIRLLSLPAYRLSGIVVDEKGAPVTGAALFVRLDPTAGSFIFGYSAGGPPGRVRSAADGSFVIPNLLKGAYLLTAARPVLVTTPPSSNGAVGGLSGGSSSGGGGVTGRVMLTERRNGVTTEYRSDPAGAVAVTIDRANVSGVRVVVRK